MRGVLASRRRPEGLRSSLGGWAARLTEAYAGLDLAELLQMIEGKTGLSLSEDDRREIRRRYLRARRRSWLPVGAADEKKGPNLSAWSLSQSG